MRHRIGAATLCIVLAASSAVAAQDEAQDTSAESVLMEQERLERARFLYDEAVACTESEDWECAERTFRTIMELRDAPAVRYSLALALFELDRYPEASRLLTSALEHPEATEQLREQVRALQAQLRDGSGQLTVALGPGAVGASIEIDGHAIPADQLAGPVPVAPGERVVTALRGDEEVARQSVEAIAGETVPVELDVALATDDPLIVEPAGEAAVPEWAIWTAIGGGAAVLIATIIIVVAATTSGVEGPVQGDFEPGVLRWD